VGRKYCSRFVWLRLWFSPHVSPLAIEKRDSYGSRISYKVLGVVWSAAAERAAKARASWTVRRAPRDCRFRDLCRECRTESSGGLEGLGEAEATGKELGKIGVTIIIRKRSSDFSGDKHKSVTIAVLLSKITEV
jgi:hypothetical protein